MSQLDFTVIGLETSKYVHTGVLSVCVFKLNEIICSLSWNSLRSCRHKTESRLTKFRNINFLLYLQTIRMMVNWRKLEIHTCTYISTLPWVIVFLGAGFWFAGGMYFWLHLTWDSLPKSPFTYSDCDASVTSLRCRWVIAPNCFGVVLLHLVTATSLRCHPNKVCFSTSKAKTSFRYWSIETSLSTFYSKSRPTAVSFILLCLVCI